MSKLILQSPPSPMKSYQYAAAPFILWHCLSNSSGLWCALSGNWFYRIAQTLQSARRNRWKGYLWKSWLKLGTVKFCRSNCSVAYNSVYTDTHTHGKVLWFQLLGTIVKGMPTQGRIELNLVWNLFVQCPRLMWK